MTSSPFRSNETVRSAVALLQASGAVDIALHVNKKHSAYLSWTHHDKRDSAPVPLTQHSAGCPFGKQRTLATIRRQLRDVSYD
ncbi:hypothetical protein [Bradyrhizobium cenepequi]